MSDGGKGSKPSLDLREVRIDTWEPQCRVVAVHKPSGLQVEATVRPVAKARAAVLDELARQLREWQKKEEAGNERN